MVERDGQSPSRGNQSHGRSYADSDLMQTDYILFHADHMSILDPQHWVNMEFPVLQAQILTACKGTLNIFWLF